MTNKRLKLLITLFVIFIVCLFWYWVGYSEDILTTRFTPMCFASTSWETINATGFLNSWELTARDYTKNKLVAQVDKLVGNYSISYAIVHECTEQVPEYYSQCIKSVVWVANSESSLFTKWMNPSNNWFGLMYRGRKMKFSSVESSIQYWVSLYKKNWWYKRTTWDKRVGTYCMSACTYWASIYNSAVSKLDLDSAFVS